MMLALRGDCYMHEATKYMEVSTEAFSPKVLKVSLFSEGKKSPEGSRFEKRYVTDYELEFYTFSSGAMMIEDQVYPISTGDIVFRRPGQLVQGILPYNCYLICFDLMGNTGKTSENYSFLENSDFQINYINSILQSIPNVFHPSLYEVYQEIFDNMLQEFINPTEGSSLFLRAQVLQLLYQINKEVKDPIKCQIPSSPYYNHLKHVIDYMYNNLGNKILLKDMAEFAGLSPNYFHKIFTEIYKITPNKYLTKLRLDKARGLLVKTSLSIEKIAIECGFENIPYFSYSFKNNYNISPGDFRKKYSYFEY